MSATARAASRDVGTAGAQFLTITPGARSAALGETGVALGGDAFSLFQNPAGLASVDSKQLSFSHSLWLAETRQDSLLFAFPAASGALGLGLNGLVYPRIQRLDNAGRELGGFTPLDAEFALGYGRPFGRTAVGVTGKYVSSAIDGASASAFAVDAGVIQKMTEEFSLGVSVRNLGTPLKYLKEKTALPMSFRIGTAYTGKALYAAADVESISGGSRRFHAGAEYAFDLGNDRQLIPRAGFWAGGDRGGYAYGFSAGIGVKISGMGFDYAWVPSGELGGTHRFSMSFKFGGTTKPPRSTMPAPAKKAGKQ